MNNGFITLHRKLTNHWIWKDKPFTKGQAWIDMLMQCNHSLGEILYGNEVIKCKRGESINSLDTWADRWGWNKSKVRRFLDLLKKENMIELKPTHKTTHLSIINYDTYQTQQNAGETQVKHKRNAGETHSTLNNNNNNNNNNNDNNDKEMPTSDEVRSLFTGYLAILNITNIDQEKLNAQIRMFVRYYIGDGDEKGKWQKQRTKFNPKSCVKNWIDKNINAYKSYETKKDTKEDKDLKNMSDVYNLIIEKYPDVLIGRIMNYYKWKDQLGMFDGWDINKIYNHLLKQASYSENQKQPFKKPHKENELDKIIGDFANGNLS